LLKESQTRDFTQPLVFMREEVSKINVGYEQAVEYIVSLIRRNFKKEEEELLLLLNDALVGLSLPIPQFMGAALAESMKKEVFKEE